jgi:TPR repeat protein
MPLTVSLILTRRETKRKILEQADVYIESASEVKNIDLIKDKITSFAAAVMQVKDTKEKVNFKNGHMTMTLTTTAQVDVGEVRKQLALRQVDASVRDNVAAHQEHLKYLESQLEAMQQALGRAPASPPSDILAADLQTLLAWAAQGNAMAQVEIGYRYDVGRGVSQDYATARQWYKKAAAQGNADAQYWLGMLYGMGHGVPEDSAEAAKWNEKASVQGNAGAQRSLAVLYVEGRGVPQDFAQAAKWNEKAAVQGNAEAQDYLAMLYAKGHGMPKDVAQAAK